MVDSYETKSCHDQDILMMFQNCTSTIIVQLYNLNCLIRASPTWLYITRLKNIKNVKV